MTTFIDSLGFALNTANFSKKQLFISKTKPPVREENIKLIFGLKAKLLRQSHGLSLSELSDKTGISISYLNEIEKGKKYPKATKVATLADALGTSYDWLVSLKLDRKMAPLAGLLQSNVLSELPLEIFGLEPRNLLELISDAPDKLNAFISTLIEIARHYNMKVENFYFSALRSYQQMYDNYFEEIEEAADKVREEIWGGKVPDLEELRKYLTSEYEYEFDEKTFAQFPNLQGFRYVISTKGGHPKMMYNESLSNQQQSFATAREMAYNLLALKDRSYTYSWTDVDSFDQMLNNFKATYFAGALLLPQHALVKDMKGLLSWDTWEPERFVALIEKYDSSPEMFMHRLSSLLPRYFGMQKLFYLRLNHNPEKDVYRLTKELHLAGLHAPHGTVFNEHYCRRWIAISVMKELTEQQNQGVYNKPVCSAQISNFIDSQQQYFCISVARPLWPTPNVNCSITLGFVVDEEFKQKVKFWDSANVHVKLVNEACERCAVADCKERVAPPTGLESQKRKQRTRESLEQIMQL